MVIGVSGVAGAGKDLFVETCMNELSKRGKTSKSFALASALKHEVKDWCIKHYGVDSVNCPREDKEKIRNFLVAHGTTKRHATEGRHWVERLNPEILNCKSSYDYLFVSDLRYADYEKDEVYWLKEELKGKLLHISQFALKPTPYETIKVFREPANEEEARNDPRLVEQADYKIKWEFNTDNINKDKYISSYVVRFIERLESHDVNERPEFR